MRAIATHPSELLHELESLGPDAITSPACAIELFKRLELNRLPGRWVVVAKCASGLDMAAAIEGIDTQVGEHRDHVAGNAEYVHGDHRRIEPLICPEFVHRRMHEGDNDLIVRSSGYQTTD